MAASGTTASGTTASGTTASGTTTNGTTTQGEWVQRVLGVSLPVAASSPASGDWAVARDGWQLAGETVDGQIGKLQSALRAADDGELREIAEFGLNGITGNHRVRLAAALRALDPAKPAAFAKLAPATLTVMRDYQSFLASDEAIEVCDRNPFGVAVTIRATLGAALAEMAAVLEAQLMAAAA
jgi:hypothetical protein